MASRRRRSLAALLSVLALALSAGSALAQPAAPRPPAAPVVAPVTPPRPAAPVVAPPRAVVPTAPVVTPLAPGPAPRAAREEKVTERCHRLATDLLHQQRTRAALSPEQAAEQKDLEGAHVECFDAARASLTSGALDVGTDILRSVAQVVLNRASRAAWTLLRKKLVEAARCDAPLATAPIHFTATCRTLGTLSINDLVSSPAVLTSAVVSDLLSAVQPDPARAWLSVPILDEVLREAGPRWDHGDVSGVASGFSQVIRRNVRVAVARPSCDAAPEVADKALWVAGMCLVEVQSQANFSACDLDGWVASCTDPAAQDRIYQVWSIANRVYSARDKPALADLVRLAFVTTGLALEARRDLSAEQKQQAREYVGGLEAMFLGIAAKDWVQTTSGAVRVVRVLGGAVAACRQPSDGPACPDALAEGARAEQLLTVLTAVGNYAETYAGGAKDPAAASTAREKILEDLVDRLVSRTHRDSGVVVSLGGDLAVLGGVRTDFSTGVQPAFPLQLGLGVGVQSYGKGDYGFHAMLTALDLGQYVSLGTGALKVDKPGLDAAVSLGATVGGWFALRETPLYVGAFGALSPFVEAQGKRTYELGLATGLYVPLLDFN